MLAREYVKVTKPEKASWWKFTEMKEYCQIKLIWERFLEKVDFKQCKDKFLDLKALHSNYRRPETMNSICRVIRIGNREFTSWSTLQSQFGFILPDSALACSILINTDVFLSPPKEKRHALSGNLPYCISPSNGVPDLTKNQLKWRLSRPNLDVLDQNIWKWTPPSLI